MTHPFDFLLSALHYSTFDFFEPPLFNPLDDLRNEYARPGHKARSPDLPSVVRGAKDLSDCAHIVTKPIRAKQQPLPQSRSAAPDNDHQRDDKRPIPTPANDSAEPKASADLHRSCHPEDLPLSLDSQFITLNFAQIARGFDQMLLDELGLLTGTREPVENCTLIRVESRNDCLKRATVSEQGNDLSDCFLGCAKTVKGGSLSLAESLIAEMTDEATFFERVDADVALGDAPSGWTDLVGAKYGVGFQATLPLGLISSKGLSRDPFFCQRAI